MAKKQLTLEEKIQNALVPEEEQPFKVPENWCWARLGSVGSIILGQYPKREDATDDDTFIPVISGVAELDDNSITIKKYTKTATKVSQTGDLVISMKNNIGKSVIADKEYCLGRGVAAFRSDCVDISYARQLLSNFKDYLYVLCAKNSFPDGMTKYETLQPVIEDMLNEATYKIDKMDYKAKNIQELAVSLFALKNYYEQLPISVEEAADKIFSSIGIRYSTVEHIWREYNG